MSLRQYKMWIVASIVYAFALLAIAAYIWIDRQIYNPPGAVRRYKMAEIVRSYNAYYRQFGPVANVNDLAKSPIPLAQDVWDDIHSGTFKILSNVVIQSGDEVLVYQAWADYSGHKAVTARNELVDTYWPER